MKRLSCPSRCREITKNHQRYFTFDEDSWFSDDRNYAVEHGDDAAFAEYKSPGIYWVHFCFNTARGRKAIDLVEEIFNYFCSRREVKTVVGLIEVGNKKALWLIRQCGFSTLGEVPTKIGLCEMFYRNKDL